MKRRDTIRKGDEKTGKMGRKGRKGLIFQNDNKQKMIWGLDRLEANIHKVKVEEKLKLFS